MKIIRSPHGAAREIVDVEKLEIPDLWHIAMTLPEPQRSDVLYVWYLAHDLQSVACGDPEYIVKEKTS